MPAGIPLNYVPEPVLAGVDGQVLTVQADGTYAWEDAAGGGGTPGGANTQLQYNNAGAFGGISTLVWAGDSLLLDADASGAAGKLFLGADQDAWIGYDGSNLVVEPDAVGSGRVQVGGKLWVRLADSTATQNADYNAFVIENSGHAGMSILCGNNNFARVVFGSPVDSFAALLTWAPATNTFFFGTARASASVSIKTGDEVESVVVDGSGNTTISRGQFRVSTAKTPADATAAGTAGEICWDANYVYVCVAANTWKRAAIATW